MMNEVASSTLESTVSAVANKATWTGSAVTVLSGLTHSDFGMWAGIAIGLAGLGITWFFKHRAEERAQHAERRYEEAHKAYMKRIEQGFSNSPPVREPNTEGSE